MVPVICGPLTQQPTELVQSSCEHLHGLSLADRCGRGDLPISILVGADHCWSLVEGTIVRGAPWEPVALATKLGYVLSGPTMIMSHNDNGNTVNLIATHVLKVEASVVNRDEIAFELGKFWDYESLGIPNDSLSLYDKFVSKVEITEGRYQVQLPFKEDHELLPDNFALCKSRLVSLLKRLNLKPEVLKHYDDVIRGQEKQGIVEPVEQGTNNGVGKVHYLPHDEVIRVDKDTTKLRIFYDASARSGRNTPSLKMNSVEVTSNDSDSRLELKKGSCNNSKKQHDSSVLVNIVSEEATSENRLNLDCIIPLEKFSSLQRLMRVTAYVLRFVSNLKQSKKKKELIAGEVTQEEMDQARELWIKEVQRSVYNDKNFDQVKVSLSLFTDDKGILRCGGRLKNAPIPYDARFPIFLSRCSRFTYLVINHGHFKVLHNDVRDTLTELRSRFWVTKGRQTVKTAIENCSVCKKLQGRSYAVPPPPLLPEFRVSDEFAFTRVGVDFAGPIYVKDVFAKKGDMNKVYIALFTCAATRAVHLELVPNLSAESFIRALARFKERRGIPVLIVSENGKTFKDSRVQAQCQRDGTQWKFNVEAAPWWGGFFERLVKSVKLSLKKCIRNARLNYDELSTVLVEVEAALSSRPLTYVFDEMEKPLTSSHLIVGRRILSVPSKSSSDEVGQTEETLKRRAKFLQRILDHFWN